MTKITGVVHCPSKGWNGIIRLDPISPEYSLTVFLTVESPSGLFLELCKDFTLPIPPSHGFEFIDETGDTIVLETVTFDLRSNRFVARTSLEIPDIVFAAVRVDYETWRVVASKKNGAIPASDLKP